MSARPEGRVLDLTGMSPSWAVCNDCQDAAVDRFHIRRESSTWASLLIMEAAGRRRGGAARMGHGPAASRGRDCAVTDDRGRARLVRRDVRCGPQFGIVTDYAMSAAAAGPTMI